jgi:hypothetical protein
MSDQPIEKHEYFPPTFDISDGLCRAIVESSTEYILNGGPKYRPCFEVPAADCHQTKTVTNRREWKCDAKPFPCEFRDPVTCAHEQMLGSECAKLCVCPCHEGVWSEERVRAFNDALSVPFVDTRAHIKPEHNYARATAESIERAQRVHQPSAVQAPERIWISPQFARGANEIGGGIFRLRDDDGDCTQYVHIDAYEAQAVRIAGLESENTALKNVAEANINAGVEMAGRIRELEDALSKLSKLLKVNADWKRIIAAVESAVSSSPTVEAAEIRRQAFDEAIRVCDSYKNEDYAINVCDAAREIAKEIHALAAPTEPEKDSKVEATG